jgi:hypothetical protein
VPRMSRMVTELLHPRSTIALAAAVVMAFNGDIGTANGQDPGIPTDLNACLAITDNAARLRCFEQAAKLQQTQPSPGSAWRLVRSPDPRGGPDAVSVMRTAEFSRSDPDLAGLMLRCAGDGIETLVVVLDPRPPRTRPRVRLRSRGEEAMFEATMAPPFTALLLPKETTARLAAWERAGASELSIELSEEGVAPENGLVALAGLGAALDRLRANCRP